MEEMVTLADLDHLVCLELQGSLGLEVLPAHLALQEKMVKQE